MKKNPLFFIALLPPPGIQAEVTQFKNFIAGHWGARHALKSPPHLTLIPPFEWPTNELAQLHAFLRGFAQKESPFMLSLNGFGAFPPRVVFIEPKGEEGLGALEGLFKRLISAMKTTLDFDDPRNRRPYHPHMTIAHRDLAEEDFPAVWQHFKQENFVRRFPVRQISLLELRAGVWSVCADFPMGSAN